MKALKERILRDGKCFEGGILKVDNFINHQMDPILMKSIAVEFVRRFASTNIHHGRLLTGTSCCLRQEKETRHNGKYAHHQCIFIY